MSNPFNDNSEALRALAETLSFKNLDLPEIRIPSRPTGEHAERQIEQADKQLEMLTAIQSLWESQAAEASANAHREAEQQKFNRKMTWVAILLAAASMLVPFVILWIEQASAVRP